MEDMETMGTLEEETTPIPEETCEIVEADAETTVSQVDEAEDEQSENCEETDFLEVKFNKQYKSLNRDETVKYAQMGMNYERFEPLLSKIDYLAAVNGVTREQFVEGQLKAFEDAQRQSIIERFGSDEEIVDAMMEYTKQKHQKAYSDMLAKQKTDEKIAEETQEVRIAKEFTRLCKEFPELAEKGFDGLPKQVKEAGFLGENLMNAYLQYKHNENKNIAAAKKQAEFAAQKSAGSMGTQSVDFNSVNDAFLKGLLQKLN